MIEWYENDPRFEPGTVADLPWFRFTLKLVPIGCSLLAAFRKSDRSLSQKVKVKDIGKKPLSEAQDEAENWLMVYNLNLSCRNH